jgi:hypothetical protein
MNLRVFQSGPGRKDLAANFLLLPVLSTQTLNDSCNEKCYANLYRRVNTFIKWDLLACWFGREEPRHGLPGTESLEGVDRTLFYHRLTVHQSDD